MSNDHESGLKAPSYEIIQEWKDKKVELRLYKPSVWVCAAIRNKSFDAVGKACFWKLFKYIKGKNENDQSISMTAPVTIESKPDADSALYRVYKMGFYLPKEFHDDPPTPKDTEVFIDKRPEMKVYSLSYPGFNNAKSLMENSRKLCEILDSLDLNYHTDPFYFAGYDPPTKLINRHNEVWFKAI